jgi:hypothetical protein
MLAVFFCPLFFDSLKQSFGGNFYFIDLLQNQVRYKDLQVNLQKRFGWFVIFFNSVSFSQLIQKKT